VRVEIAGQAIEGALEVLRLLRRHAEAADHPAAEHVARRRLALRRLLLQRERRGRWWFLGRAHATSSSDTCDATISR
jgi:hypothetical protein